MTNYSKYRGDDVVLNLTFEDADGSPINITGYTIFFTLKNNKEDTDAQAVLTKNVTTHTNPTQGETQIALADTETDDLCGTYYYDIQYKDGSGNIKTVDSGVFTFKTDITIRITAP